MWGNKFNLFQIVPLNQLCNIYFYWIQILRGLSLNCTQFCLIRIIQQRRSTSRDDLGVEITKDQWETALQQTHKTSVCVRHGLLQFKVLLWLHWSKQKLHKKYPEPDLSFDQCGQIPASLDQMFWKCPKLSSIWSNISNILTKVL